MSGKQGGKDSNEREGEEEERERGREGGEGRSGCKINRRVYSKVKGTLR